MCVCVFTCIVVFSRFMGGVGGGELSVDLLLAADVCFKFVCTVIIP